MEDVPEIAGGQKPAYSSTICMKVNSENASTTPTQKTPDIYPFGESRSCTFHKRKRAEVQFPGSPY